MRGHTPNNAAATSAGSSAGAADQNPNTPRTQQLQDNLQSFLHAIQDRMRQYEAAMVQFKIDNDNVSAAQLFQDLRVLQQAERMHREEGGMSVINLQIPPDLSVRLKEMAGREGKLKEEQRRKELEEKRRAEKVRVTLFCLPACLPACLSACVYACVCHVARLLLCYFSPLSLACSWPGSGLVLVRGTVAVVCLSMYLLCMHARHVTCASVFSNR